MARGKPRVAVFTPDFPPAYGGIQHLVHCLVRHFNELEVTVTIDDAKMYTKPFVAATNKFKFSPQQQEDEQLCVPSEAIDYLNTIAIPAGQDEVVGQK